MTENYIVKITSQAERELQEIGDCRFNCVLSKIGM